MDSGNTQEMVLNYVCVCACVHACRVLCRFKVACEHGQQLCTHDGQWQQPRKGTGLCLYVVSSAGSRLLVSVGNSVLYLYDTLRPDIGPTAAFTGHATSSFFIKACFSPDGTHILSGSSDKNAYIWQVGSPSSFCLTACRFLQTCFSVAWQRLFCLHTFVFCLETWAFPRV